MADKIRHDYEPAPDLGHGGTVCSLSFGNPDVKAAFEQMFALKKGERIQRIEVEEKGITAYFLRN